MIIKHLTKQQRHFIEVKNRIYETAARLLKTYDYNYLTIRHICREAKVSIGTFYHHFENKDDLLAYFFTYGIKNYLDQNDVEINDDVVQNMINLYDVYLSFCLKNGIEFLSNYYSTKNKALNIRGKNDQQQVAKMPIILRAIEYISNAKRDGFIKEEFSPYEIVQDISAIMKGIIFEWCLTNGAFDLKEEGFKLMRRYFHGLLTEKYFNTFNK